MPVDYADFKHATDAAELETVINDPANPASTFNLYQEMSYGQLYPNGVIGSIGVDCDAGHARGRAEASRPSTPQQVNTCTGVTSVNPASGEPDPAYTERITDGWYQLPGMRTYYGADANGSALVGALGGVGALQAIDSGCGPTAKAAYDAAVVADPDIDYNDFDTDKDGVVDFFEVVFQGCGGNGASQLGPAGGCEVTDTSDNIWPHSSSLEFSYTDPATGLTGYASKDRLKDLEGNLLFYTDDTYTSLTTGRDGLPGLRPRRPVQRQPRDLDRVRERHLPRVRPLARPAGLLLDRLARDLRRLQPDGHRQGPPLGRHRQEGAGLDRAQGARPPTARWTSRTGRTARSTPAAIEWVTPDGRPYTLSAAAGDYGIHNGEAYAASLPGRQLLDPAKIEQGASGKRVWYSRQGNDFGCPPVGGHNLDFAIPGLEDVPAGTPITATFKSYFEIEWDYDYGFVLTGDPRYDGQRRVRLAPVRERLHHPGTQNPNANSLP